LTGVPLLGILSKHYTFPLARVLVLTSLLIFANRAEPRFLSSGMLSRWRNKRVLLNCFSVVCLIAAVALAYRATVHGVRLVGHLGSQSYVYSRFLNSEWDSFMVDATRMIDTHRKRSSTSLWSTYSALLEAHYGIFPPAEDYIIHSSGPQRFQHYLETFRTAQPEFVQTMTQDFDFEEWLQNERWEFYEDLLDNYEAHRVGHAMIWQRKDAPWRAPSSDYQTLRLESGGRSVALPMINGPDRIGVVRVRYHARNQWAGIPLLGKTPRYLASIEGSPRYLGISFPPYLSDYRFPVQLQSDKPVTLRFRTESLLSGVAFELDRVEINILPWQSSQRAIYGRPPKDQGQ